MPERGGGRQGTEKCLHEDTHVEMLRSAFEEGKHAIFECHSFCSLICGLFPPFLWSTETKIQTENNRMGQPSQKLKRKSSLGCPWEINRMGKLILSFLPFSNCKSWPHPSPPLFSVCLTDKRAGPTPQEGSVTPAKPAFWGLFLRVHAEQESSGNGIPI